MPRANECIYETVSVLLEQGLQQWKTLISFEDGKRCNLNGGFSWHTIFQVVVLINCSRYAYPAWAVPGRTGPHKLRLGGGLMGALVLLS